MTLKLIIAGRVVLFGIIVLTRSGMNRRASSKTIKKR